MLPNMGGNGVCIVCNLQQERINNLAQMSAAGIVQLRRRPTETAALLGNQPPLLVAEACRHVVGGGEARSSVRS